MNEETWFHQVMHSIQNDPFHNFAVFELELNPNPVDHRGVGEELQVVPCALSVEAFDEEDGLDLIGRYLLHGFAVDRSQAQHIRKAASSLDEKAFQFFPLVGLDIALDNPAVGMNDYFVELNFLAHSRSS